MARAQHDEEEYADATQRAERTRQEEFKQHTIALEAAKAAHAEDRERLLQQLREEQTQMRAREEAWEREREDLYRDLREAREKNLGDARKWAAERSEIEGTLRRLEADGEQPLHFHKILLLIEQ